MSEEKERFIRQLAKFMADDQAAKSVKLQAGDPLAVEWAALRASTPVIGWVTVHQAEATLREFLS